MKIHLLVLLTLSLTACQSTAELPKTSPYFKIPIGSYLVLNQALEIAPTSATVRLQFGQIISRFDTQDFEPTCVLESNNVDATAQRIEPDRFKIIRVRQGDNALSAQAQPPTGLISVSTRFVSGGGRQYFKTELFLRSEKQPQVLAMTCQHAREAGSTLFELRPLTVAEIQQALGAYFTLQLRDE